MAVASFLVISLIAHHLLLLPALVRVLRFSNGRQGRVRPVIAFNLELARKEPTRVRKDRSLTVKEDKSPRQAHQDRPRPRPPEVVLPEERKLLSERPRPRPRPEILQKAVAIRLKMVHQDNEKEEPAPRTYRFLSQKNRNVKEETRARQTVLRRPTKDRTRLSRGKARPALEKESPKHRRRLGDKGNKEATKPIARRKKEPPRSVPRRRIADKEKALPGRARERITRSEESREARIEKEQIELRRSASGRRPVPEEAASRALLKRPPSLLSMRASVSRRKLDLRIEDRKIARMLGKSWKSEAEEKKDPQRRKGSQRASKSPWEKKWELIKAAIENYIPEVKPGNQTALQTRHHPFAKYISAAHRSIHPLWGDGYLVDWDVKPDSHELNVQSRRALVEMVINRDGTLHKIGLLVTSGSLVYDTAAMDVVLSAAPYPRAPKEILSADGRVYLHWGFHRDQRQCGTFGVNAYILKTPRKGSEVDRAHARTSRSSVKWDPGRLIARLKPHLETERQRQGSPGRPKKAIEPLPVTSEVRVAAAGFMMGLRFRNLAQLGYYSDVPFLANGRVVARDRASMRRVLSALLKELHPRGRWSGGEGWRRISVHTASELRKRIGLVPRSLGLSPDHFYGLTRLGRDTVILVLARKGSRIHVAGIHR